MPASAKVVVNEGNGVNITMENDAMKLNIAVEAGGRISQLVNKKTGRDMVALWGEGGSNGGLLDDRIGPKRVIIGSLVGLLVAGSVILVLGNGDYTFLGMAWAGSTTSPSGSST